GCDGARHRRRSGSGRARGGRRIGAYRRQGPGVLHGDAAAARGVPPRRRADAARRPYLPNPARRHVRPERLEGRRRRTLRPRGGRRQGLVVHRPHLLTLTRPRTLALGTLAPRTTAPGTLAPPEPGTWNLGTWHPGRPAPRNLCTSAPRRLGTLARST